MADRKERTEKTVCVFCGSSFGSDDKFAENASILGKAIADRKWGLVYGGGTTGLMGTVAKSCYDNDGYVHGIIPDALVSKERSTVEEFNEEIKKSVENHKGSTPISEGYGKTTIVPGMHKRKQLMGEEASAFIAMPGGYGTLEEILEVTTWSQLGIHNKPIVFFNIDGFYDDLLTFIDSAVSKGFISAKNRDIIEVGNTSEEVLELIEKYQAPDGRFNLNWESR